jgi:hypothetical protein
MAGLTPTQEIVNSAQYKALVQSQDAIEAFCKPVEGSLASSDDTSKAEDALGQAWKALIGLACQTPYTSSSQAGLVSFLLNLQSRPDVEKDGQVITVQDMAVWRDLPLFGWQMREAWNAGKCALPVEMLFADISCSCDRRQQ